VSAARDHNGSAASCWVGPFRIGDYLARVVAGRDSRPPDAPGIYVLSEHAWKPVPTRQANIIYAGQARYMRYRVGQFLSDLCGFTGDDPAEGEAYEHRGGHLLWHRYCTERGVEPLSLYFAWCPTYKCINCAESRLLELVTIPLSLGARRTCQQHHPALELLSNCSASVALPDVARGR
jgi:hypothetical protein